MLTPITTNVALVPPSVTSTSECGEVSPKLFIEFNYPNPNSYGVASGEEKVQDIRTKSSEPGRADVSDRAALGYKSPRSSKEAN
ncbi:hypothetical protein PM082_004172 [Marasmius tenuissimus]|nr:hypothetical protein PM082_004172 [Marasmius tenuissimus]